MSLIDRAASAVKRTVAGMTAANGDAPSSLYRNSYGLRDNSFNIDARNAYMTLASVLGSVGAYTKNCPQIKFAVVHPDGEPWPEHPLQWIIRHPNDDMGEKRLAMYNAVYKCLGGASRLKLYRNDQDQIVGWRPYTTAEMSPVPVVNRRIGRDSWIEHYWHTPLNEAPERIERRDILSLTFHTINPITPQADLSPIQAAFMDINADHAITKIPSRLLKNAAFMSAVFALGNGAEAIPDDAYEVIKADIEQGWTDENQFKPMVVRAGGSVSIPTADLRNMSVDHLGNRVETRICWALDVNPRYAGAMIGIDNSTSDNFVGAWLAFVKGPVTTQAQLDADAMTDAFQRENWKNHPAAILYGGDRNANSDFKVVPDMTDVEALKTELMSKHDDARKSFAIGGISRNELRVELGKGMLEGDMQEFGDEYKSGGAPAATGENEAQDETRTESVMQTPKPKM